jgi:hypothetical protein
VQRGGSRRTSSIRHCVNGKRHAAAGLQPNLLSDQESKEEKISIRKFSEGFLNNTNSGVHKPV